MANRDIRVMNFTTGQQIESDEVMKRLGELEYRNHGAHAKIALFDEGKALITKGLRVEASSLLTVNVTAGNFYQRDGEIVLGCVQTAAIPVTLDAASGVARIDIIEGQIRVVEDKTDYSRIGTVATGSTAGSVVITNEEIKRDIKYELNARKKTDSTTPTAATAGTLVGTVAIAGTIDLQENYLINISDGEDGDWVEVDCRGTVPNATTRAEIIAAINASVGRVIASASAGDTITLTGSGTGWGSYFSIKPPITDPDADALDIIFGVSAGGIYKYNYRGNPGWFKLAEIDMDTATTTITAALIRNIEQKDTWASEDDEILVKDLVFTSNEPEWNEWDTNRTYAEGDIAYLGDQQFVSLTSSNSGNDPLFDILSWMPAPDISGLLSSFQSGEPVVGKTHRIHDVRDATNYKQFFKFGKYKIGSRTVEAWGVHVDGTVVTGDTDLENIFDPGGSDEYKYIDSFAPDSLGTRTLKDYKGRLARAISAVGGATGDSAAMGEVQEDQMQGHAHVSGLGAGGLTERFGSVTGLGNSSYADYGATAMQTDGLKSSDPYVDSVPNGTPRTGLATRDKSFTVGVPYIVVIKEV